MASNNELQKQWSWLLGRWSYFLVNDHSKRGFLLVTQRMLDSALAAQPNSIGEMLSWKQWWVLSRKVVEPSQTSSWKRELRLGGQDAHEEQWRPTGTPQQHTTSKSGCKTLGKMLLKQMWEMTKHITVGLCGGMLLPNMWVVVEDYIEDKVPHNYQETFLVDLPPQEKWVQTGEANRIPISQACWEVLESNQAGRTGRGLRVKVYLSIFKMKRQRMLCLPFMAVGHSYLPPLRLGWPTLFAICFSGHYRGSLDILPGV